ncbi:MAG: TonB-dependent receptor [SAR92 bacterium BACL26 MAG-121220-bin70]|jgi:iron complex outermembrane recepter protein|uniref:TonB-dependent receptor n=1 Tax=SAR92 bacterium BACL26 MAG-121220-bin70 TaxID=1655626 RepID=A0A0R2U3R6_9GAMM|nr:MAG: TonB-dependent receptor [SAR92 bacterium BACL26 MAG-121220-bin70]
MNPRIYAPVVLSVLLSVNAIAIANEIEEVIVTSSLIDQTLNDIENPLHVVSGEDISTNASQSLGESLDNLLGVSSTDYGSGVGQPIIRGMSGNRVKILNNGMVVRDVAGIGADHVNDVDLNNIQQIEIVRGPSSLLYANGTIGGIINIVDSTIAREDFTESELKLGLEAQSVNDGDSHNLSYQNNLGGLNFSLAYKDSQFDNFDVPTGAILHGDEHYDEHEEEVGFLSNSDFENNALRLGVSKAGDWGYFGVSVNSVESIYGIPFHGDEDGDEHEDEHEDEHGDEHEGERIFSTTDSEVVNVEGAYIASNSWLKKVNYFIRDTDYSLTEQHAEEHEGKEYEGEDDGEEHEEGPTVFSNESREYGAIFDLSRDDLLQKISLNFVGEDMSMVGEEAFMNPTASEEMTLGYYLSKQVDSFHLDLGIRHDRTSRKGSVSHKEEHEEEHHDEEMDYFSKDYNATSFAMSLSKDLNENFDLNITAGMVERTPSAMELFMNGPHLAAGRLEIGNTALESEKSANFDATLSYEHEGVFGTFTLFKNDVADYIYLQDETEEAHEEHDDEDDHGGLIKANYLQQNAQFVGYELQLGTVIELGNGDLTLSFGRDSVAGEFRDDSNIPRMTPDRNIYGISYSENDLELKLNLKDVESQRDIGTNETVTSGFSMLDFHAVKTFTFGKKQTATVSFFAKNLLDEVARNHSSFVKDEVPLPGRNIGIKLQLTL